MRIIAFGLTLFLGITIASFFAPCSLFIQNNYKEPAAKRGFITHTMSSTKMSDFDVSRNYTESEARNLIGKRVRNLNFSNTKCPTESGNCLEVGTGELGSVVGILPSVADTYLIQIKWDETHDDQHYSHSGAFVTRAGKEVSFEIIK